MKYILIVIIFILILIPIIKVKNDKSKLYQLPFLYSITILGFIFPSLVSNFKLNYISDQEFNLFSINLILCFSAALIGYRIYSKKYIPKFFNKYKDDTYTSIVISIFFFIGFSISITIDPYEYGNEQGGFFAIKQLFARFLRPTALIIFCFYLVKKTNYRLVLLMLWLFLTSRFIIISGRRSELFTFFITIGFPLFFIKNYIPTKGIIALLITISGFAFIIMPVARNFTKKGDFGKLLELDFSEISGNYIQGKKTNEIFESAVDLNSVYQNNAYSYGAIAINKFTHQYVSSTIFGKEFKEKSKITTADFEKLRKYNYKHGNFKGYLARTGFVDTFFDFGFFSFIFYFIFGMISKHYFIIAYKSNDIFSKIFYSQFSIYIFLSVYDSLFRILVLIIPFLLIFHSIKNTSKS
ncbi:hypothetical protein KMW28_13755 [Flammeovirga yaeyamensis]|uniref:Oligosaccharide repeat unit polymerase n=1 Tax=Flammeovirga yaeyamensis TaxID=367791 RepID=A0AAX1MZQ6_9BACT|nr:hypothetical protein [Flammeovirga yaeyamensis]MBB3700960.1 hypothetical protein [Flammeovirga yaeyamensis]NMF38067.1 hypothetical protein [Flammeovirga yaeyamensis]QWG00717.1 hypothetical protein KMW28_13755 [Flammeovirga yaeyamensis]